MIPNTPETLIPAALAALETGQPNLAGLYMRKASAQLEERRRARLSPFARLSEDIEGQLLPVFAGVAEIFGEAADRIAKARGGATQEDSARSA